LPCSFLDWEIESGPRWWQAAGDVAVRRALQGARCRVRAALQSQGWRVSSAGLMGWGTMAALRDLKLIKLKSRNRRKAQGISTLFEMCGA
jgi:hypothetical protein